MAPAGVNTAPATLPFAIGPSGKVLLGGPWTVAVDPHARGSARGWASGAFPGREVTVPYVVNGGPVTGRAGIAELRRERRVVSDNLSIDRSGLYALRFESVNHRASVWIDGRLVGRHVGSYLPFEVRTDLSAGRHTLVVRADWRSPWAQSRAGWHRTWFNFGGINRGVSIRPIGASELLAPTLRTRLDRSGGQTTAIVDLSVQVHNNQPDRSLTVSGWLQRGDQRRRVRVPRPRRRPGPHEGVPHAGARARAGALGPG